MYWPTLQVGFFSAYLGGLRISVFILSCLCAKIKIAATNQRDRQLSSYFLFSTFTLNAAPVAPAAAHPALLWFAQAR